MASSNEPLSNTAFENLRTSLKDLQHVLDRAGAKKSKRKGLRTSDGPSKEVAEKAVYTELSRVWRSPLGREKRSGYGVFSGYEKEGRALYSALKKMSQAGADADEEDKLALTEAFRDLTQACNPKHPWLQKLATEATEEEKKKHKISLAGDAMARRSARIASMTAQSYMEDEDAVFVAGEDSDGVDNDEHGNGEDEEDEGYGGGGDDE